MERETTTLTTTNKHVVTYYTYATGREARQIEQRFLQAVEVNISGDKPAFNKLDTTAPFEAEKIAIGLLVKSIDGVTEKVVEVALDLPQVDYEEIVTAINEVTKKKK